MKTNSTNITKPCGNCNKEVTRILSQANRGNNIFCNSSCAASFNNKGICRNKKIIKPSKEIFNKQCIGCNKIFSTHLKLKKYCEDKCRNLVGKKHWDNNNKKICPYCQNNMSHDSITCKNCININLKSKTLKEYKQLLSVKGKHPSWTMAHVRSFNRSWNKNLTEFPCQYCGYDYHVELCHIKPLSSFDENTTLCEINDPSNILVLCPNHHYEFDSGKLSLNEITPRV